MSRGTAIRLVLVAVYCIELGAEFEVLGGFVSSS